jgi:hypothetical protein
MQRRFNEGKVLDAVIRHIERRDGFSRTNDGRSPDDLADPDPQRRVDYVVTIGAQLYAFEHTGIEPFDKFIEMGKHNRAFFQPIVDRFKGRPGAESWELMVPIEASTGLSGRRLSNTQKALGDWIEANVSSVPVTRYGDRYQPLSRRVPGMPFQFQLYRRSFDFLPDGRCELSDQLHILYFASGNVQGGRVTRLEKTCDDKLPKLGSWKRSDGAETVLVLEENDISLTNHQRVFDALADAEAGRTDLPDEVYVVGTSIEPWLVTCLRRDGKTYYDDSERFHEFDPATLVQLSNR